MNRTDRLLAIVLELQGKQQQRAEDLASTFEVSRRTIYRDVLALCEAGVPVVSTPGRGYNLVDGYFLPPLSFDSQEAIMLLLGSQVMAQSFDDEYRRVAEAAGRKIAGVLPPALRTEVEQLRKSIQFVVNDGSGSTSSLLPRLRQAVLERRRVRSRYFTRLSGGEESEREVDPYTLIHMAGAWYLIAYCHLRLGIRHFRLERIEELRLLNKRFNPPPERPAYREDRQQRGVTVRVLFTPQVARWVLEERYFYVTASEMSGAGLLVTMRVRHEDEVLRWLLGWGTSVRVLEPPSLQKLLSEEARRVLQSYEVGNPLLT